MESLFYIKNQKEMLTKERFIILQKAKTVLKSY